MNKTKLFSFFALLLFCLSSPAQSWDTGGATPITIPGTPGTNRVFDPYNAYISPRGDDANIGTLNNPKRTIAAAKNVVTNGGWIHIGSGEYTGNDLLKKGVNYELRGA